MDEGQNYTAFSSRGLLDMIGDLNDKALEASRMKDFMSEFLEVVSSTGLSEALCSHSILESSAAHWKWLQLAPLDSMPRVLVWYSEAAQGNAMCCL